MAPNDMPGHECLDCGEFIAADSTLPSECPNCGGSNWAKVTGGGS